MLNLLIWLFLFLPLLCFAFAWNLRKQQKFALALLTLDGLLLLSATARSMKSWLLGADYSHRLFTTVEINLVLVLLLAGYLAFKKNWMAMAGALILALDLLYLGAVNSVV